MGTSPSKGDHQNVARLSAVLDALASAKEHGLRQTDIVEQTGLTSTVIFRLLNGLCAERIVTQDLKTNRYHLGFRMLDWAASSTERYGLAPYVDSCLDQLCDKTGDTVYFTVLSGWDSVCVDRREGAYPIKTLALSIGTHRPLGVGAGSLAILATQSDDFIEQALARDAARRAQFNITDSWLREHIAQTRTHGVSLNDGRVEAEMSGIAVPIKRRDGQGIAAFTISAINARLSGDRRSEVIELLKEQVAIVQKRASAVLETRFAQRYSRKTS